MTEKSLSIIFFCLYISVSYCFNYLHTGFTNRNLKLLLSTKQKITVENLKEMSVKEALKSISGMLESESDHINGCDIIKSPPSICKYIIANPVAFFENEDVAKYHGFDLSLYNSSYPIEELCKFLPVLYIAGFYSRNLILNLNSLLFFNIYICITIL